GPAPFRYSVHRPDDRQLAEGVIEMVVAADYVGYAHVVVVHHYGEHVGRRPVGAQQHEIVEFGILHGDAALHAILDHRLALARGLEADDEWSFALLVGIPPGAFDSERPPLRLGAFALCGQFLLSHPAAIGVAG